MGEDWTWWFVPTHPELDINYFEKLYTIKELKKKRDFDEDDYDLDKKLFAVEKRKSSFEKKLLFFLSVASVAAWTFYARYEV